MSILGQSVSKRSLIQLNCIFLTFLLLLTQTGCQRILERERKERVFNEERAQKLAAQYMKEKYGTHPDFESITKNYSYVGEGPSSFDGYLITTKDQDIIQMRIEKDKVLFCDTRQLSEIEQDIQKFISQHTVFSDFMAFLPSVNSSDSDNLWNRMYYSGFTDRYEGDLTQYFTDTQNLLLYLPDCTSLGYAQFEKEINKLSDTLGIRIYAASLTDEYYASLKKILKEDNEFMKNYLSDRISLPAETKNQGIIKYMKTPNAALESHFLPVNEFIQIGIFENHNHQEEFSLTPSDITIQNFSPLEKADFTESEIQVLTDSYFLTYHNADNKTDLLTVAIDCTLFEQTGTSIENVRIGKAVKNKKGLSHSIKSKYPPESWFSPENPKENINGLNVFVTDEQVYFTIQNVKTDHVYQNGFFLYSEIFQE